MKKILPLLISCCFVLMLASGCSSKSDKEPEVAPQNEDVSTSANISETETPESNTQDEEDEEAQEDEDENANEENSTLEEEPAGKTAPTHIDGHKVIEYHATNDEFHIKLDGTYEGLTGELSYDPYYYGGFVLNIPSTPDMESFEFSLEEFNSSITPPADTYTLSDEYVINLVGSEFSDYVKNGNTLQVECNVSNYEFGAIYASEPFINATIDIYSFEDPQITPSTPDEYLTGFDSETLFSQDTPMEINYEDYSLVIVPMQISTNMEQLTPRIVEVPQSESNEYVMPHFLVFGALHNVTLTYTVNGLDPNEEPVEVFIADTIENECVYIDAVFPTDFSSITITGYYGFQGLEEVTFSLNDMMDSSSYKIITFDAYTYPNEAY